MKKYLLKLNQIETLAQDICENFDNGVIILKGDLASGKTTFTKEFVKYKGIVEEVTSPTFSLQQCYGDRVFHYDIYNHGLDHFISLGMLEELEKDGVHLVEWGDEKLKEILDAAEIENMTINIKKIDDNSREYEVNYAHA
ncbi:MAG: tRNA (adenosine(37)-N6)-threonylcarbamoyltransferase complex ATPase subunit type 1 TsaE [Sulfurimonas sp.]|uniref:tRNA (adenosine(37)-N6)-threonylcarbamoyltransferase complex ATPase subunit type 1 TsaE n=1 Tax=Sulfurimonas sp. TaxID=2022749 RepID=UPI0025FE9BEC|nr:tRNA (adenosine(37)-N6)-threonylcarbamoyltransferase complex ATPase subunit type 1 TsaE [Sulfurimonas sp.]MCK9492339.1 tRNA (adenosine(37)-N6)-threonylcarbamoyltransferase complex ATPase subunit type 1 TsaE [Sulfurimonas sp.]